MEKRRKTMESLGWSILGAALLIEDSLYSIVSGSRTATPGSDTVAEFAASSSAPFSLMNLDSTLLDLNFMWFLCILVTLIFPSWSPRVISVGSIELVFIGPMSKAVWTGPIQFSNTKYGWVGISRSNVLSSPTGPIQFWSNWTESDQINRFKFDNSIFVIIFQI